MPLDTTPEGVGLGFRAALAEDLLQSRQSPARFLEVAPENYLGVGGQRGRWLAMAAERWPIVSHGLCGDFAGAAPIDLELLRELKRFLRTYGARWYSDHLCLTHIAGAESHDLLPLPFTDEAVERASARIRAVQDVLELPIAVENVSAYLRAPGGTMDEPTFVRRVVEEADCALLLDVNNVYVNAVNFGFDARAYLRALPLARVVQIHVAGHHEDEPIDGKRLLIDTHGAPIVDPVYDLLADALALLPQRPPVLLERDHEIPKLGVLEDELRRLQGIVDAARPGAPRERAQERAGARTEERP
jgi:uncharacterized protein